MNKDVQYEGFTPISLELMRLGQIPGFDLYISGPNGPVLYRERQVKFTKSNLQSLVENNVQHLFFINSDQDAYYTYMENNLEGIVKDRNVTPARKASIVYDTSTYLAKQLLSSASSADLARRASAVMDTLITFTGSGDGSYKDIVQILPQDYYTHSHSANVATYSLALGRELGMSLNTGLKELTMGALLHDVGKSKVPPEILVKKTPLSKDEMTIIRKHVDWGMEIVKSTPAVPFRSYPAIHQHHERLDGSGYPLGITNIHLFGRIVAVADTFDAMTTNRPYKVAVSSFKAVSFLKSRNDKYDKRMVMAMVEVMAERRYPVQSIA